MVLHLQGNRERYPSDGRGFVDFNALLVQKHAGIMLFCGLLTHAAERLKRPMSFIADHSFGLFFVHGIVIALLMRLPAPLSPRVGEPMVDLAIYGGVVIVISLTIVIVAKYAAGRYSRYIIGC